MLLNIRYYVLMITSVFLALGIGIIIGFSLDGQEIFIEQQQGLISELEQRFNELKMENTSLRVMADSKNSELTRYESFSYSVFSELVRDCLYGIRVAIIESEGNFMTKELIDVLELTGVKVTSVTMLTQEYINPNIRSIGALKESMDVLVDEGRFHFHMARGLIDSIAKGQDTALVRHMKELGLIKVSGIYDGGVDFFLFIGGGLEKVPEKAELVDIPLIKAIKMFEIPVVGAERSGCETSHINLYKPLDIPTIDNIDSVIGRYSLIRVLQGNAGHYGIKNTAEALFPQTDAVLQEVFYGQ